MNVVEGERSALYILETISWHFINQPTYIHEVPIAGNARHGDHLHYTHLSTDARTKNMTNVVQRVEILKDLEAKTNITFKIVELIKSVWQAFS